VGWRWARERSLKAGQCGRCFLGQRELLRGDRSIVMLGGMEDVFDRRNPGDGFFGEDS